MSGNCWPVSRMLRRYSALLTVVLSLAYGGLCAAQATGHSNIPFLFDSLNGSDFEAAFLALAFLALAIAVPLCGLMNDQKDVKPYLALGTISLCAGIWIFAQSGMRNFVAPAPAFWNYSTMLAVYLLPSGVCAFAAGSIGYNESDKRYFLYAQKFHVYFAVGAMFAVATGLLPMAATLNMFYCFTAITMGLLFLGGVRAISMGSMTAIIFVVGLAFILLMALASLANGRMGFTIPLQYLIHWGILLFIGSLTAIVRFGSDGEEEDDYIIPPAALPANSPLNPRFKPEERVLATDPRTPLPEIRLTEEEMAMILPVNSPLNTRFNSIDPRTALEQFRLTEEEMAVILPVNPPLDSNIDQESSSRAAGGTTMKRVRAEEIAPHPATVAPVWENPPAGRAVESPGSPPSAARRETWSGSPAKSSNGPLPGEVRDNLPIVAAELRTGQKENPNEVAGKIREFSHEVSTPLGAGILAASHLEQEVAKLNGLFTNDHLRKSDLEQHLKKYKESAEIILTNLKKATDLTKNLRTSVGDTEEQQAFNVKSYVSEILLGLSPRIRQAGHAVHFTDTEDSIIFSYPRALYQIITNLIVNSLVHAYDPGKKGNITLTISYQDGYLNLLYRDDGRGMEPHIISQIFTPHFTTNRNNGSMGLGLSIVHDLVVNKLGGKIDCDSVPGAGTTFTIRFPAERR